ncbi:MAG: hypothetical protein HY912_01480 [Desulfomonile tiedjei]|uniref:Glycosyltransferase n=1 Tax=Desulfomonile tiedjei TaxID=2358 RepID=A0A9D6UZY8_9BACT|nr:hypothetical protein [Desulfomonile tiedjei]
MVNRSGLTLAIVLPCCNEEAMLPSQFVAISELLEPLKQQGRIAQKNFVFYVDDGSKDATWRLLVGQAGVGLNKDYCYANIVILVVRRCRVQAFVVAVVLHKKVIEGCGLFRQQANQEKPCCRY